MLSEAIVVEAISQLLDVDEATLTADCNISKIEGWDSVNALRVLTYLERKLGAPVDYKHFMEAEYLGDLWGARAALEVES
jgi:acyl carrier protein